MPSVAIIGPDGAGKTTVCRMLAQSPQLRAKYVYMGANPSAANITLPTARVAAWAWQSPQGRLWPVRVVRSALGLLHRMSEEWYRQVVSWWYQARGYIVVYDRHFVFDIVLQHYRAPDRLTHRIHRWSLARWYPRPDLVLYLDAPPQMLFARKPEHRPEKLAEKAASLLQSVEQEPHFARIDASQPLENVCRTATELILSSFGSPVRGGMARRPSPGVGRGRTSMSTPTHARAAATPSKRAADTPVLNPAYIVSRFPKVSETFVFNELLAIERYGVRAQIYPLLRERESVVNPEVRQLVGRARFHPPLSLAVLRANAHFARTQSRTYFDTWCEVLRGTWGSWNFFFGALGILPKSVWLASEMTRAGITHIHAHFANHPTVAAFVVNRLTGIPFSFTAHGFDIQVDRRMLAAKIKAASFVVAVSKFNKKIMVDHCGDWADRKIQVVHCGVDTEFFSAGATHKDRPKFDIVCVARLVEVKGHRFLIEACQLLKERGLDFSCHLVGDGPLRRSITHQIVSLGLEDRIILHGSLSRSEVARLMARADVVVLASSPTKDGRREGIPVSLMEAMASAVPVVATAISGVPELVDSGTNGLLVAPGNVVELANALEKLARNPAVSRAMGLAGREKVIREFNQDMSARSLVGLFAPGAAIETPAAVSVAS